MTDFFDLPASISNPHDAHQVVEYLSYCIPGSLSTVSHEGCKSMMGDALIAVKKLKGGGRKALVPRLGNILYLEELIQTFDKINHNELCTHLVAITSSNAKYQLTLPKYANFTGVSWHQVAVNVSKHICSAGRHLLRLARKEDDNTPYHIHESNRHLVAGDLDSMMSSDFEIIENHIRLEYLRYSQENPPPNFSAQPDGSILKAMENVSQTVKRATVNAKMIDTLQKKPEAKGWSITQWVTYLECARSTVHGSAMCKELEKTKLEAKLARVMGKSRRTEDE